MHIDGSQCVWGRLAALVSWCSLSPVVLAGVYSTETSHFKVVASSRAMADEVGAKAEEFRHEVAREWLGEQLADPAEKGVIQVAFEPGPSRATTWVDPVGTAHHVTIVARDSSLIEALLKHEIAHTVLLTALGPTVPDWANEGIASRYDNRSRQTIRERKLREFASLNSWPRLDKLFASPVEAQWSYTASVAITDFLVERGGKGEFIAFLRTAGTQGYDTALRRHYDIDSVSQLEELWHRHTRLVVAQKNQDAFRSEHVLVRYRTRDGDSRVGSAGD
jgi:hypothetical protein